MSCAICYENIERLEERLSHYKDLISRVHLYCKDLSHDRDEQHGPGEECPVEKKFGDLGID